MQYQKDLEDRYFNTYEGRLFFQGMTTSRNKYASSFEGKEAALKAVKEHDVLQIMAPKGEDETAESLLEREKVMAARADAFAATLTEVVTLMIMGALTEEELVTAIREMKKDTKVRDKIRRI